MPARLRDLDRRRYRAFVRRGRPRPQIATALAGVDADDVDAVGRRPHAISEAMRFAPVPPTSVRDEVAAALRGLAAAAGERDPPVAVRSSALGEDSQDATFAGQQETYLWVRGAEHVCDAVRDCWVSLYSPPAISYRARLGDAAPRRRRWGSPSS